MKLCAVQQQIPRLELEQAIYPADLIGYRIIDMLNEIIAEQEVANTFDVETLGIGGRWDALTNAFLLSANVGVGK